MPIGECSAAARRDEGAAARQGQVRAPAVVAMAEQAVLPKVTPPVTTVTKWLSSQPNPPYVLSALEFAASAAWTVATLISRLVVLAATRTSASAWRTATEPLTAPVRLIVYPPGCMPPPLDPGCDAAAASAFDKPARVASGSISKFRAIVPDSTAPNRPTHGPTSINSAGGHHACFTL